MRFTTKDRKQPLPKTDLLVAICLEGKKPSLPATVKVPRQALSDFKGEFREARQTDAVSGPAKRVLFVGVGKKADVDAERVRRAVGLGVNKAGKTKSASCVVWLTREVEDATGAHRAGVAVAEAALMASYSFTKFKGSKSKNPGPTLKAVTAFGTGVRFRDGGSLGKVRGEANLFARDLQNTPGNHMRPRDMAAAARKVAGRSARIRYSALNETQMTKLGMGSLLSVSRGSTEPAYLIHLTYRPKGRSKGRVCFVGKGLTFDAGGISLKPSAKMDEMKFDMSGGAAVLGIFHALPFLDVPFEVHGLVPTSENLPDGKANKPGDIVTAMDGTTIEVLNTDAEGRLILADALAYGVKKVKPDVLIDMATLTGAVVHALGHELTGMFATTDRLRDQLTAAGAEVGELVWPLPLLDVHKDQMKGQVADLRNINSGQGNGSTAGAAFLSSFVGDVEWAHLDIAGTAWGSVDRDYVGGAAGSGVGVRLCLEWLENGR
ncbi:MAG: leucyl aminopeptidase [Planctomycetota bacterium]|nr:leucyl aminopeptidase [Planctomycetota bacterium]